MPSNSFITSVLLPICVVLLLLNHSNVVHGAAFKEGDSCEINGADYMDYNFTGQYTVAGKGCSLENNTKTNCLCSIDYTDGTDKSPFIWQCFGAVKFGPIEGKICPKTVPVVKQTGVKEIDFSESQLDVPVPCNSSHPTGYGGDDACGYSECETGGSYSAICGCTGKYWICLHSKCNCGDMAADSGSGNNGSATGGNKSNSTSAAVANRPGHMSIFHILSTGMVGIVASSLTLFVVGF
jgi:hypothetical protein